MGEDYYPNFYWQMKAQLVREIRDAQTWSNKVDAFNALMNVNPTGGKPLSGKTAVKSPKQKARSLSTTGILKICSDLQTCSQTQCFPHRTEQNCLT